jgi:hypothetical protein
MPESDVVVGFAQFVCECKLPCPTLVLASIRVGSPGDPQTVLTVNTYPASSSISLS